MEASKKSRKRTRQDTESSGGQTNGVAPIAVSDSLQAEDGRLTLEEARLVASDARKTWLFATKEDDLKKAESLYKGLIIKWTHQLRKEEGGASPRDSLDSEAIAEVVEECRKRLYLLLCQSGRDEEVAPRMRNQGFVARLGRKILNYAEQVEHKDSSQSAPATVASQMSSAQNTLTKAPTSKPLPCAIADEVLPAEIFGILRKTFRSSDSYWEDHGYSVEPPSPYFSYVLPLAEVDRIPALGQLALAVKKLCADHFGAEHANRAKFAEIWAHLRPHASGHQMHFDSDDEGRGGIRNPLCGSIFFLGDNNVGGPSIVTNQKFGATSLATKAWVCWPRENRLVVFDGTMLHGVVPGKGVRTDSNARRGTLMCALWETIQIRDEAGPGSARPIPYQDASKRSWLKALMTPPSPNPRGSREKKGNESSPATVLADCSKRVQPDTIAPVWETIDGAPWDNKRDGMPPYDQVFQGF
jgi:hypothetical protein